MRPPTSVPIMVKKRRAGLSIGEEYTPSAETLPKRSRRWSRGIRTWSNQMRPLSTPLSPSLMPLSPMRTPAQVLPSGSRIGTRKACTPCRVPSTINCAKTVAICPWTAALPSHSLWAPPCGVSITNSNVAGS